MNLGDIIPCNDPREMEKTTNLAFCDEKHHSAWVKTSHTPVALTTCVHALMIDNTVMKFFPDSL